MYRKSQERMCIKRHARLTAQYTKWEQPFLVAQTVKNQPAVQETQVQSLGQEDTLEEEMANSSSTLAWRTPWMEEPGRLQSMGLQRVRHD